MTKIASATRGTWVGPLFMRRGRGGGAARMLFDLWRTNEQIRRCTPAFAAAHSSLSTAGGPGGLDPNKPHSRTHVSLSSAGTALTGE